MALLVLIGLIIVLLFYAGLAKNKKRALIISAVILGGYLLYVRLTCGPDPRDVKVMKPMAEAISSYIIKHGVPKSLEDIPGLPYRLEGCERKEENLEECYFYKNNNKYKVKLNLYGNTNTEIDVDLVSYVTETGYLYELWRKNEKEKWEVSHKSYSWNDTGICNPMRQ